MNRQLTELVRKFYSSFELYNPYISYLGMVELLTFMFHIHVYI